MHLCSMHTKRFNEAPSDPLNASPPNLPLRVSRLASVTHLLQFSPAPSKIFSGLKSQISKQQRVVDTFKIYSNFKMKINKTQAVCNTL